MWLAGSELTAPMCSSSTTPATTTSAGVWSRTPGGAGTFLQSKLDGRVLTLSADCLSPEINGCFIETFGMQAGQASQLWSIEQLTQGPFKIVGVNGLVVDVPGGQSTDGLQVQQFHDHNGANQQWLVLPFEGNFKIISPSTGLVLQVPPEGPHANAPVHVIDGDGRPICTGQHRRCHRDRVSMSVRSTRGGA